MSKEELYIKACKFAVWELIRKGSTLFAAYTQGGRHIIDWLDVVDYLEEQEQKLAKGRK